MTAPSVGLETVARPRAGVEASRFGGEYVLLEPSGKTLRGMNATAGRVWELMDGTRTVADVGSQLATETRAPTDRVTADVLALVQQLMERNLVERVPGAAGANLVKSEGVGT